MRTLSDTISRLAAMRDRNSARPPQGAPSRHLLDLPAAGINSGQLKFRAYLPGTLAEGAALVVVLHGCTQDAPAYNHGSGWSRLAREEGFAVLFAEQQRSNNPNLCFNWFLPGDVTRDSGEVSSIREAIHRLVADRDLDPRRVFVTGLSAGGAMAASMLATYPETFAGGAIIAGLPHGCANTVPEAFDRMRGHAMPSVPHLQRLLRSASRHTGPWPKVSIWHGSADQTVAASNMEAIAAQFRGVHGVDAKPDGVTRSGRLTRQIWRNADGSAVIETNLIAGMGHGTPVSGRDSIGTPGPYMLDVGISSTREIARWWGLTAAATQSPTAEAILIPDVDVERPKAEEAQGEGFAGTGSIKKTIEEALRAAGLMR